MEIVKLNELPINYNMDKELLRLLADANEIYGEYKSKLKNSKINSKLFLDSLILPGQIPALRRQGRKF